MSNVIPGFGKTSTKNTIQDYSHSDMVAIIGGVSMAVIEKTYAHPPAILWNLINDIIEMRKGKVKSYGKESISVDTDMYGISTTYLFSVVQSDEGTKVTVETEGEDEDDIRGVELMFTTLENMLVPFDARANS